MSYNISITRNDVPADDKQAWEYVEALYNADSGEPSADFVELIKKLTEKFPCICDLPDDEVDDGVWSDGPLVNNAGDRITVLGVVFSQVENVIPFVIETSNRLGFVVFDYQTETISRPSGSVNHSSKPSSKGFWQRLFS
ncbi:hypothetical protein [uncultured Acetobacteroides sp.]|uniref:hypothetical protein n=1 Tax=uncultured Acetobacteroides sp. TaxID=1760811 RepID=UPI0029F50C66|nr:hypothetical protein [uncultured Acetobacteroides sp.]